MVKKIMAFVVAGAAVLAAVILPLDIARSRPELLGESEAGADSRKSSAWFRRAIQLNQAAGKKAGRRKAAARRPRAPPLPRRPPPPSQAARSVPASRGPVSRGRKRSNRHYPRRKR